MKLIKIFSTEFSYLVRNVSTGLYLVVLIMFTLLMNVLTTPGDGIYANNTFHIISIGVIGGFIWLVMGATVAGEAAARDVQTRMHPLTYSTPVSKVDYLGGRFLAAFAVNALLILSLPLGVLGSFYLPGMDEGDMLPFRPSVYMSVYFLIALPNVFVATALQFSFASLSRNVMAGYFASLVLAFFPQIIAISAAILFENQNLVKLLDPVGVAGIIGSELQTWAPAEKNTRLVTLQGMFLWNRILWLGLAVGLLVLTYVRFSFTHTNIIRWRIRFKRKANTQKEISNEAVVLRQTSLMVPIVERTFNFKTYFLQAITIAWTSFKKIAKHPAGLTLVGAIAVISSFFGNRIISQFGIPLLPTTTLVLDYFTSPLTSINTAWVVIPLLIMYFAGVLVWNERDARINDIADATPVPAWVLLTGKFLGLVYIIIVWMAMLMIGGILMQTMLNYTNFEISLYVQMLFGLQLVDYLLFAMLALVVHAVVNQKNVGYLVMLLVFIFMAFPSAFQVEHKMLVFGADPGWWYTDMRGFGNTIGPWVLFKVYWIAWTLFLAVVAKLLWARGREQSLKLRLKSAKRNFTRTTGLVATVAIAGIVIVGGVIFYNTNVLNQYLTGSDINKLKAEYELRYGKYKNIPQPQLTATKLHVQIYPERQQAEIRGTYTLVNNETIAIDSIHLGSVSGIELNEVTFSKQADGIINDGELHHYIYKLEKPMQPGDTIQVSFAVNYKQQGFSNNGTNELVVKNGTYFTNYDLLPTIGYQRTREINDEVVRRKYNLAARPAVPSLYDEAARKKSVATGLNTLDVIVGTPNNEVAVAPGVLHRSWTDGERSYFHYSTGKPIGNEFAILSSNYSMQTSSWNGVAINIYYHPQHAMNIERMLQTVSASLKYFTDHFGPYPYTYITLVERAGSTGGASADASMINYGEQYSLLYPDDSPDGFDLPYYILAHEVAHQWWGVTRLTPAHVEGAGVLIESLAVFSGMQVLEKTRGENHSQQYVNFLHSTYEMPRSLATPSLLQANESFLYYRKGGLALHGLSKYIGTENVNRALRELLEKRSTGKLPLPTSLDLYKEIQHVTPDSLNYLLRDLFEANTFWRLKTKQFSATQTSSGDWEVTLNVQAEKVVIDSTGSEKGIPMHDWLEIGIYEKDKGLNEPLYLKMHRIRSGEQIIKVTVPRKPERGGIDPNSLTIDIRRDDNIMYLDED